MKKRTICILLTMTSPCSWIFSSNVMQYLSVFGDTKLCQKKKKNIVNKYLKFRNNLSSTAKQKHTSPQNGRNLSPHKSIPFHQSASIPQSYEHSHVNTNYILNFWSMTVTHNLEINILFSFFSQKSQDFCQNKKLHSATK